MYDYIDAAMLRAAAWPPDRRIPSWPDLTGDSDGGASWRPWLEETWRLPGFAAALEQASPVLAHRVQQILEGRRLPESAVRKAVVAVMRYVLRASGRATPFGLFAGVAPARTGGASAARIGTGHQAVVRPDAAWLATVIERLEADRGLQPHLTIKAHPLAVERDGHVVLEHRPVGSGGGAPAHVQVRLTTPVKAALDAARAPIRTADLAAKLAADFPHVPAPVVHRLLANLIDQRLLISNLRPPSTATDPLAHLLSVLGTEGTTAVAEPAAKLCEIAHALTRHNSTTDPAIAHTERAEAAARMRECSPASGPVLSLDLRLDAEATIPASVAAEAARAAAVLIRLAGRGALSRGWVAWHGRFLERFGLRAMVPLLDAVDSEAGLGYPAGFLGGPPAPAETAVSGRDAKLLTLAQNAALHGHREIVLDDAVVTDLAEIGPERPIQPTTEVTVRIAAPSVRALDAGEFTLAVVGVSRSAGTMTGRFLSLLGRRDRERMAAAYATAATATENALRVQVASPPLYPGTGNVARTPLLMPAAVRLGECHDDGGTDLVDVEDIAVTADAHRLYLISISRRRPLEFVTMNAVEPTRRTHPLVRFLTEAPHALSVPCTTFDWGVASCLPFLPSLRYGRTILSPARWRLAAADLADPAADWARCDRSLCAWRDQTGVPSVVYLGDGDQRLRLDLDESSHRALLHTHMRRHGSAVLRAESAADAGWIGGHPHEVVIPLATTRSPAKKPYWLNGAPVAGREHGRLPGCDGRFFIKLYARRDRHIGILTRHLPDLLHQLAGEVRWWFLPYRDPDDHLRLRLTVPDGQAAEAAAAIGAWTQRARRAGLLARVQWDTDFPETARFGGRRAWEAAEVYFAADSETAVAQLACCAATGGPDGRALTAASMLDVAIGLIGDMGEAMRWLIGHSQTTGTAPDRGLYDQAITLANPHDHTGLASQPGGEEVIACWTRRRHALTAYRATLTTAEAVTADVVLPELLHLHHTRMATLDMEAERRCVHLARAAALSWTAREEGRAS
ncbi:lantibiotic dehydratase [Streptomyces albus]|uniref:lantibiotic dehydratase n=1 Tax=Streptomyces albus TaxID=1888 RepID=UPI0013B48E2B|nr:lantibiotic dehydratase [Streptomyces albus]QID34355.1 lantibiotic dehydratase [Streptomyces albus]